MKTKLFPNRLDTSKVAIQTHTHTGQGLDKDLHPATQPQHQVQCRFLLDVVVRQGAAVLQLLAGEDQALLVGGIPPRLSIALSSSCESNLCTASADGICAGWLVTLE
jgi:hypothetical protein